MKDTQTQISTEPTPNNSDFASRGDDPDSVWEVRDRLAKQSGVVQRLGVMLLSAGAGAYRVKSSMARLASAVGIEEHHAQVTFTEIATTTYAAGTFRTELAEQRALAVNAARIDALRDFVQSLKPNMSVEEANARLDEVAQMKPLYGGFMNALASGVACAGFCFLNRGGLIECICVFFAAFFGQALRRLMLKRHMNHFGVWMACGFLASLSYVGLVYLLRAAHLTSGAHEAGFISAILFLVPGFPLVTAILDLVRMDFSAGISRLSYVMLLLCSAAIPVWLVSLTLNWSIATHPAPPMSAGVLLGLRLLASFVAAFGFAMLFNASPQVCFYAALLGAFVNTARLILQSEGLVPQVGAGGAAVLIGLLAALASTWSSYRHSRVSLSVPAVVIMIPGVPFFRGLVYLNNGQSQLAAGEIIQGFFVILAIGVGLALSRMLSDPGWAFDHDTAKVPDLRTAATVR